jgi:YVTN family beta-propeller protein
MLGCLSAVVMTGCSSPATSSHRPSPVLRSSAYAVGVVRSGPAVFSLQPLGGGPPRQTITLPGAPDEVATIPDRSKAYLLDSERGVVIPVDLVHGTQGQPLAVGRLPVDEHFSGDGASLYVTDNLSGAVIPIDTATDRSQPALRLEQGISGFVPAPSGARALVGAYSAAGQPGSIFFYDPQSGLGSPVHVGMNRPEAGFWSPDGRTVWIVEEGLGNAPGVVIPVDAASHQTGSPITVGSAPSGADMSRDGRWLVVSNSLDATASILDLAARAVTATVAIGAGPADVTISADGSTAFVSCGLDRTIVPVDLRGHRAGAAVHLDNSPAGVALPATGGAAWVLFPNSAGTVTFLDHSHHALQAAIPVGNDPTLVIAHDSREAWVANALSDTVQSIDLTGQSAGPAVSVSRDPIDLRLTPDGRTLVVLSFGDGSHSGFLTSIDTASARAQQPLAVGTAPSALVLSPDGRTAFVASHQANTIAVVDLAAWRSAASIALPCSPTALLVTPDGRRLYAVCNSASEVVPVSLSKDTAAPPITVAGSPRLLMGRAGKMLFIAGAHELQALDIATDTVANTRPETNNIVAMSSLDDHTLLALDNSGGSLLRVNTANLETTRTLSVGSRPDDLALAPDGVDAYVLDSSEQKLYIVAVSAWKVITTIDVSPNVAAVVLPSRTP